VVDIDSSLGWVLAAAFAKAGPERAPEDGAAVLQMARKFEVSGRIVARRSLRRGLLSSELERELLVDYHTNLAVEAQLGNALERVAGIAASKAIPLIALKYAALRLTQLTDPGSRVVGDLDLLVPIGAAESLFRTLVSAGFSTTGTRRYPHQLQALSDSYGAVVELHVHIPGVHVARGHFVTADELLAAGLVRSTPSSSLLVPNLAVLSAHALAHGLHQNRSTPQSYSLLRMLADLADISRRERTISAACAYLDPPLNEMCGTAERLCDALADGFTGTGVVDGTPEHTLLRHCLAAQLDRHYADRLRSAGLVEKLRESRSGYEVLSYVFGAFFPPQRELDAIYGPADSSVDRVWRRLVRPVDVSLRAVRRRFGAR
jgi:Uncharacterised nucleotidyltransferase